jgi:hypothetical protein
MTISYKAGLGPWPRGEVKRHCARCEAEVERLERSCPRCGLALRKECPECHYWNEVDRGYCLSCHNSFDLPAPAPATVKIWHEERTMTLETDARE